MYIHTSSEARAETTWMHAQATHPQSSSKKVMLLACMLSAETDHNSLWSLREWARRKQENTVSKESIRNTRDQSRRQLEVLRRCKPGNMRRLQENLNSGKMLTNNAHKDRDMPSLSRMN